MAGIVHKKYDNIPVPTQADLDAQIAKGNFPPGTLLNDIVLSSDWNDDHKAPSGTPIGYVPAVADSNGTLIFGSPAGEYYTPFGPTTATVGGIPSGTDLGTSPILVQDLFTEILYPYTPPYFNSFDIQGQSQAVEVGATLSGTNTFEWSFGNSGNVAANTMDIIDVTGSTVLASNISDVSPYAVNIGTVTLTAPGNYSWQGRADNTHGATFTSSLFTVAWYWKLYYGTSPNVTLTESQIKSLSGFLSGGFGGNYNFGAGDYKYFVWPDSFGSPTATTGFKDAATNLSVAMASSGDNAAYSNVQNGWYYALVSVTNANGVATNYRVYRTKNILGSGITIIVS